MSTAEVPIACEHDINELRDSVADLHPKHLDKAEDGA